MHDYHTDLLCYCIRHPWTYLLAVVSEVLIITTDRNVYLGSYFLSTPGLSSEERILRISCAKYATGMLPVPIYSGLDKGLIPTRVLGSALYLTMTVARNSCRIN